MIYNLAAAVSFLTRFPLGRASTFDSKDVFRASRWFPLVGGLLGGIYATVLWLLAGVFTPLLTATILVGLDAWLTRAIHFDGLADTADGFGGGGTREDVLRIMRDHAVGSFGAVALMVAILLKIASIGALIDARHAALCLILTPVLGRWSAVLIGATQPYARSIDDDRPRFGRMELIVASVTALGIAAALDYRRGLAACLIVALSSMWWAWRCRRRIGGVTGDTLGAAIEMSECLVLLFFTALR